MIVNLDDLDQALQVYLLDCNLSIDDLDVIEEMEQAIIEEW